MKEEIVIRLKAGEIVRVLRILTDGDEKEALIFLKEHFEKKVEEALKPPCGPETLAVLKAARMIEPKAEEQEKD